MNNEKSLEMLLKTFRDFEITKEKVSIVIQKINGVNRKTSQPVQETLLRFQYVGNAWNKEWLRTQLLD